MCTFFSGISSKSSALIPEYANVIENYYIKVTENQIDVDNFYAPGLKGPPGASSNWIVRLSVRPSVCLFVRLSVIPSRLQTKCNI